jgi:transcription-repair coupling factor (superfamily II helicase)
LVSDSALAPAAPESWPSGGDFIRDLTALLPGDLVVHADHGIGKFEGLTMISAGGVRHDCLCLIYADNAKLSVPVENLELLSRFRGEAAAGVALDRLGRAAWRARKAQGLRNACWKWQSR